jgi:NADPH2:quinone reductase
VLVDGATGGVGHLAVQLAGTSGAIVYGQVRRAKQKAMIKWCGDRIVASTDLRTAAASGPYHLILDSIGGAALPAALTMLQPNGTCVHFGVSESPTTTFESGAFFRQGGVKLYGLILCHELRRVEPASEGLTVLAHLAARVASAYRDRGALDRDCHHRPPPDRPRIRRESRAARSLQRYLAD